MTKQTRLDARGAREKLKLRGNPYWGPKAGHELDLGYRRIKSGIGSWVMRRYVAETKTYTATTFAAADDRDEADGVNILSYRQAQIRARELAKAADEEERVAALGPPLDVSRAVADYVEERERRHDAHSLAGSKHNCRRRLAGLLAANPRLAKTPMAALTGSMLGELECDLRTRHDLKASLNRAAKRHRDQLPSILRDVIKDGLAGAPGPARGLREAQVGLPDGDVRAICAAAWDVDEAGGWGGGLARLVIVLAATGARFSQVARMTVADVQTPLCRLMIPASRKGRLVKASSHVAVRVAPDVLDALAPAINGRKGHELLFMRPSWRLVAGSFAWQRNAELEPWRSANDLRRPFAEIVARAGLPPTLSGYCLRHSSIARALRAGLPVSLIAKLHDTSAAMVEKNYSAQIVSLLDELAERAVISLAPATVTPIAAVRR